MHNSRIQKYFKKINNLIEQMIFYRYNQLRKAYFSFKALDLSGVNSYLIPSSAFFLLYYPRLSLIYNLEARKAEILLWSPTS